MSNGDAALAASGIVVTVMMLAVLPALGVAQAVSVLVRTAPGEKRPEKSEVATWSGLQVALMYILLVDLTFVLFRVFISAGLQSQQPGTLGAGSHHRAVPADVHRAVHIL